MKLKELRLKNGLLQSQIAEILQIKKTTYSNYEIEKTQAPIIIYKKLANFYNVSLDYLLDFSTNQTVGHKISQQEKDLIDMYKKLSNSNKKLILKGFYILLPTGERKKYKSLKKIEI